jgi:hypothetical protein
MATKQKIPKALREQVWITHAGKVFECKCLTTWCNNTMTVFDFQCGHNVPESKKGKTDISNLVPICSRCNLSMGSQFTFTEWCIQSKAPPVEKIPVWKSILQSFAYVKKEVGIPSLPKTTNRKPKHSTLHGFLSTIPPAPQKKPTVRGLKKAEKK